MKSMLFRPSGKDDPPSGDEGEILGSVLDNLEAALGNVDSIAREIALPDDGLAGVRTELERAIELVRERLAT